MHTYAGIGMLEFSPRKDPFLCPSMPAGGKAAHGEGKGGGEVGGLVSCLQASSSSLPFQI